MIDKVIKLLVGLFSNKVAEQAKEKVEEQPSLNKPKIRTTDRKISIVIDPGHGGSDPGAISGDLKEAQLVLEISACLVKMLDQAGHNVHITRADNHNPLSRNERIKRIKAAKANILVSIHANSYHKPAYGIETLYNSTKRGSKGLASYIQKSMMGSFSSHKDRGIKERNRLYVLKTMSPAVLVEVEFINTAGDFIKDNTEKIAEAVFHGIQNYIEKKK